jgi:hypothetical protein
MNKTIISAVAITAIFVGWLILNPGNTFDYVVNIDQEVTRLESEFAALDVLVSASRLTSVQATAAKVRIIARLDNISNAASESKKTQLTPEQRTQLPTSLLRLKSAVVQYQTTLSAVEDTAIEADVKKSVHSGGSRHLNLIFADTIDDVEETIRDSIQNYEADVELDAQVDAIVEKVEAKKAVAGEESSAKNTANTSGEVVKDESDTDEKTLLKQEIQVSR